MKINEMRALSPDQLGSILGEHKKELFNLRFQKATGNTISIARYREVRKNVARILTLLNKKLSIINWGKDG